MANCGWRRCRWTSSRSSPSSRRDFDPGGSWPAGTRIGHVHLNVADLGDSEDFYVEALGFDVTVRSYPGALFVSAGGYHHHLGLNTWSGEGRRRPLPAPSASSGSSSWRRTRTRPRSLTRPGSASGSRRALDGAQKSDLIPVIASSRARTASRAATLGDRLAEQDARRFVGRTRELEIGERFLGPESSASVLLVHGDGGIGKSALLRELGRRAEALGFSLHWVEARDTPPAPDALETLLAEAQREDRPLVVFDTFERIASLGGYLRRALLPTLPDAARVVIASRDRPEDAWFRDGWEAITAELAVEEVSHEDAAELLRLRGVAKEDAAGDIIGWAGGSPLALSLAASAAEADPDWEPRQGLERPEFVEELVRRLTDEDVFGPHLATMGAAAIARVTTPELLAQAVPGCDPQAEFEWLAARYTTEAVGAGIAYHDLVAQGAARDHRPSQPRARARSAKADRGPPLRARRWPPGSSSSRSISRTLRRTRRSAGGTRGRRARGCGSTTRAPPTRP